MPELTPPKNDKARKAWLASLKDGDEVVWQRQAGAVRVGTISTICDRFSVCDRAFTLKAGTAVAGWNSRDGHYLADGWLLPVTDELRSQAAREVAIKCALNQIRRLDWHDWAKLDGVKLLAIAAILATNTSTTPETPR